MVTFKSIVVLDTETTSLPVLDHNTTKIVELAALGCEVDHIQNSNELPRVIHKLVLLFDPLKTIHYRASETSGLDNEMVQNLKPFKEKDVEVLEHFIMRLPQPACIIAHNGYKFDFPILRRGLRIANRDLPDEIYCADSLVAFRELLPSAENSQRADKRQKLNETTPPHQKPQPTNTLNYKTSTCRELFPDVKTEPVGDSESSLNEFSDPQKMIESTSNDESLKHPKSYKLKEERDLPDEIYCADSLVAFRELLPSAENYETPAKRRKLDETTPPHQKTQPTNTLDYKTSTCRELFPDVKTEPVGDSESSLNEFSDLQKMIESTSNDESLKHPKSYKLKDVYNYFFGEDFKNSHRAESDSMALLSCIMKCHKFVDWMERNAVPFNSIEPLC